MDNPSKIKTQTKASSFTLIVAFICVALIGLALIPLLPVKLNPSRTLPGFTVQFSMPGTSSRVVEIEATSKLEAMLARIKGIKNIYSTSDNGSGSITIELDKYADIDAVRFEASTIIRQTWPQLPDGVSYPYIRMKRPDENAVSPKLRINTETKEWEMSIDNGTTWTSMGVRAEGTDGDSMFESVDTVSNPGMAVFTLADGGKLEIPMQGALNLAISAKRGIFVYDETQTFTIESKGVERMTWTKPDGWKVSVEGNVLTVVAPAKANSYAETEGVIALIGMAGNSSCMAELTVSAADTHSYTITFEGSDWAKWVACNYNPGKYSTTQLGSPDDYAWVDETTQLTTGRPTGFMNGWGYPWFVCSYNSNSLDQSKYGNYLYDLYVYNPDGVEDSMTGGGRNGSDNFLTTFGYLDFDFPYGDGRPILEFADNKARTIRSLYVNSTCYFYSVATSGNGLSPELTKDVTFYATGFDANGKEIKTITMIFATPEAITKTWTKWDLSELGPIVSLRLNQAGGADNGYGYSLPAYYAVDDITVEW